jgi:hypothetical protein
MFQGKVKTEWLTKGALSPTHVYHWLSRNDFNSSDYFRHRLWWIRAYLLIGIKVIVCLLSKNIGGNDVTSRVFLSLMFLKS